MTVSKKTIGYLVQLGGIAAFATGAIFSFHHVAIAAAFWAAPRHSTWARKSARCPEA